MKTILFVLFMTPLLYGTQLEYYESSIPGCPVGNDKVVGGLYKKSIHTCDRIVRPVEDVTVKLANEGHDRFQKGVSIALLAFIISLAFKNSIVHSISSIGIGLGGFLALDGLLKIFMAQYLVWCCWGAFLFIVIMIVLRFRHIGVEDIPKKIKERKELKG